MSRPKGYDSIPAWRALLDTPVLDFNDVPLVAFGLGDLTWPPLGITRRGGVYLARTIGGLVKVGFSATPLDRVCGLRHDGCRLHPELFIAQAETRHEHWLHELFRSDWVGSEFFSGDLVERFLDGARMRSVARVRDFHSGPLRCNWYAGRIRDAERRSPKRAA